MGEAFLDNVESDNVLKISIPISELFNKPIIGSVSLSLILMLM